MRDGNLNGVGIKTAAEIAVLRLPMRDGNSPAMPSFSAYAMFLDYL